MSTDNKPAAIAANYFALLLSNIRAIDSETEYARAVFLIRDHASNSGVNAAQMHLAIDAMLHRCPPVASCKACERMTEAQSLALEEVNAAW